MGRRQFWLFLLPAALLLHLGFWLLYVKVISAGGLQKQKAALYLQKNNKAAFCWIMGDSHPMMSLNPAILQGSFNWAGTSEYYFLTWFKLRKLLQENPAPGIIVLPLDLHSYSAQGNALLLNHELDDTFWCRLAGPEALSRFGAGNEFLRWWISARYFPYAGQFYRLFSFRKKEGFDADPQGFVPATGNLAYLPGKEVKTQAKSRFDSHFGKFPAVDSLQVKALDSIISLCRQKAIRLVLVSFPLSKEYRHLASGHPGLHQADSISTLRKKTNHYLNYSGFFKDNGNFFSDPDHLSPEGARIFSLAMRHALDSIRKIPAGVR